MGLGEAVRHEGVEVVRVEMRQCHRDEQRQGRDLDDDQDRVQPRALARTEDQQARHDRDDDDGRQIDQTVQRRPLGQGDGEADAGEQRGRIARPAHRDGRDDQAIFEDQAPAHHPGDQLAEHGVAIGVGAARGGHHRRHFGIGQRGAGADRAGDREGEQHGRPRAIDADADQGEDAGADDRSDAEREQVRPGQTRDQPGSPLRRYPIERFPPQQAHMHSLRDPYGRMCAFAGELNRRTITRGGSFRNRKSPIWWALYLSHLTR